ncbi:MAG: TAXI family TRAP transporter solute-binding subunit, partial [Micromonosporaceae bacterium]
AGTVARDGLLGLRPPRSHRRRTRWRMAIPVVALLLVATATLTGGAASPPSPAYPSGPLPIATGERDTVYYQYGLALRDAIRLSMPEMDPYLPVSPSGRYNLEQTADGKAQLAFASADTVSSLSTSRTDRLATLARLYDDYLHLVVRRGESDPIKTLPDLRGKRVSIGLPDSGTERTALQLMRVAKLDAGTVAVRRMDFDRSSTALRERKIDAFFFFGGLPTEPLGTLNKIVPIQLIDLGGWMHGLSGHGDYYTRLTIPSSTYGLGVNAVTTVGVPNFLVVPIDMDPDLAYALTELLFTYREEMARTHAVVGRLDRRAAITTPKPLRLHPGAMAYYRDTQI